jgi:hypothetical protein
VKVWAKKLNERIHATKAFKHNELDFRPLILKKISKEIEKLTFI